MNAQRRDPVVVTGFPTKTEAFWPGPDGREWGDEGYLDDPGCLAAAQNGDTLTVFQFDGDGMRKLLKKIGASSFEDLVAATTLFRPGPMGAKGDAAFVARKRGEEPWEAKTPGVIREICAKTHGLPIYQESIMLILNRAGLIPMPDCERVRKAISTKKTKVFAKYRETFVSRAQETCGWTREEAESYWDTTIQGWSSYGFNRSHAVAYTIVSCRGLYLKTYYPLEWFCSVLSHLATGSPKVRLYMGDAARHGVSCEPPDVQKSGTKWKISESSPRAIVFPTSLLKGVGKETSAEIESGAPYASLTDFFARSGVGKREVEPLAAAGALDSLCANRAAVLPLFEAWKKDREKRAVGTTSLRAAAKAAGLSQAETKGLAAALKGFSTVAWLVGRASSGEAVGPSSEWKPPAKVPPETVVGWLRGNDPTVASLCGGSLTWMTEAAVESAASGDPEGTALLEAIEAAAGCGGLSAGAREAVAAEVERTAAAAALDLEARASEIPPWSREESAANESAAIGFPTPFSHPLKSAERDGERPIAAVSQSGVADGVVVSCEKKTSKSKKTYYSVVIDDGFDSLRVTVWEDQFESNSNAFRPVGKCVRVRVEPPGKYASATLKPLPNAVRILAQRSFRPPESL